MSSSSQISAQESAGRDTAVFAAGETDALADPVLEALADFAPPPALERYVVVDIIGRGGLGLVYAAWDPELERRVAVKLIRSRKHRETSNAAERFLREAQALAKLSHPNVVTVYDVGTYDDGGPSAFVVMELITGQTLSEWLGGDRRVSEIIRTFLMAGRGLAAAHAQGLVHRDFKPDNVMVCADGTVKVLDFGLALIDGESHSSQSMSLDPESLATPLSTKRLTETGLVMGTPRYMAPEQHSVRTVGPATDQFAFCLALLRALRDGRDVYQAVNLRDLARKKRGGQISARLDEDRTPRQVEKILLRGLAPEPRDRWPSMDALLGALADRTRRRWVLPGLVAASFVAAAGWAVAQPAAQHCEDGADRLEQRWTPSARAEIKARLEQTDPAKAPTAWAALQPWAVTEVDGWSAAYRDTCAQLDTGKIAPERFDKRMQCLRLMAAAREELLEVLLDPSEKLVRRLPDQVAAMLPLAHCDDDGRLAQETILPARAEDRERVVMLRERLQRARTLSESARIDDARALVVAAVVDAREIGFEPVVAEAVVALGLLEVDAGEFEKAVAAFDEAAAAGESSRQDFAATEAAAGATFVLATRLSRPEEAKRWLGRAKSSLARAGNPPELALRVVLGEMALLYGDEDYAATAELLQGFLDRYDAKTPKDRLQVTVLLGNLAIAHQMLGDYPAAVARLEEALELRIELLGAEHPKIGPLRYNLANTYSKAGRYPEAVAQYELAIAAMEERLGAGHFEVANYYMGRGVALKKQGRYAEARRDYEHALGVMRESVGVDAPQVATLLANLGNLEKRTGNRTRALELHQEALALREKRLGAEHSDIASSLDDIGSLLRGDGQVARGLARHERALAVRTKVFGDEHPTLMKSYVHIGNSHFDAGDLDEAARWFDSGQALHAEVGDHESSGPLLLYGQGRVALARRNATEATDFLTQALAAFESTGAAPERVGDVRFTLARARWMAGEKSLARDALAQARVELRTAGVATEERLAELEAWAETLR